MKTTDLPGSGPFPWIQRFLEELSTTLEENQTDRTTAAQNDANEPAATPLDAGVLIAEDDEDDYEFLRDLLLERRPDLRVTRFTNGADLTDHLLTKGAPRPALLILDLNMPFKDGREALRDIKAVDRFADLPVFVLTTSASPADESFAAGFPSVMFATKPVRYQDYLSLVKKVFQRIFPEDRQEGHR